MKQQGFTLVELLVAAGIASVIMASLVPTLFQMLRSSARNAGITGALGDIDVATHWLTRDVLQGQNTDLVDGAPPVSHILLTWEDSTTWTTNGPPVAHYVSYTYAGTELQRDYDGQITTVGRYLTVVEFSLQGRSITLTLTSSPDSFTPRSSRTMSYILTLRPDGVF